MSDAAMSDADRPPTRAFKIEVTLISLLCVLSIVLRGIGMSDLWFGYDGAFWVDSALDILEGSKLPLRGQSPGLGPMSAYLTALGYLVFGDSVTQAQLMFAVCTAACPKTQPV